MDRRLMLMENFSPWGVVCPCPGAIYSRMILKLGVKHLGMELYKVYINHDPGMTLTYFMARST